MPVMATVTRSDSIVQPVATPTTASKPLPQAGATLQKATKAPAPSAPRIDLEPLYTALKAAIGDKWGKYKESISLFILGQRNQAELSRAIDPFLSHDPTRVSLHNQLIAAIYANAGREPPEPGVASWVSANDKPTTVAKAVAGDAAEQRLKAEVMALPARERRRLKAIVDEPFDMFARSMYEYHSAREIKIPDMVPTSAGGFNKTNWDLEIRKRYAQPLFSETHEFPDADSIAARMLPICYEEGLPSGNAPGCAELMNVAAETFVKEALSTFFGRVRSNGDGYIRTARFKRQLEREEEACLRGEARRNAAGLLPAEVEAMAKWRPLGLGDLMLNLRLGDAVFGLVPSVAEAIMARGEEAYDEYAAPSEAGLRDAETAKSNGIAGTVVSGHGDETSVDENDWGWPGGTSADRDALNDVLDDCLAIGQ